MNKPLLAAAGLALATLSAHAAALGVVDLEVIKNDYTKAKDNDKNLKAAFDNAKAEMGARVEKLKKLQADAEAADKAAKDPLLNAAGAATKQAEAKTKIEDFLKEQNSARQFEQQTGQYFQQRAAQVDREIMTDVKAKADLVAKERKLDLVLPKGLVLASGADLDISADVVKKLNEAYAANPVTPGAPITAPTSGVTTAPAATAAATAPAPAAK